MVYIHAPQEVIARRTREYHEGVNKDLNRGSKNSKHYAKEGELLSNRDFPITLAYALERMKSEDGVIFDLMSRNREPEEIEKAAESVIKIIEAQRFTVAEALLFLSYVDGMILATPVSY